MHLPPQRPPATQTTTTTQPLLPRVWVVDCRPTGRASFRAPPRSTRHPHSHIRPAGWGRRHDLPRCRHPLIYTYSTAT
eukprot:scaffold74867_cov21-Tisochrysis_lutea.AAC.3